MKFELKITDNKRNVHKFLLYKVPAKRWRKLMKDISVKKDGRILLDPAHEMAFYLQWEIERILQRCNMKLGSLPWEYTRESN